jgi:multidrug efflux pump subunit AcrA (membrane-fusion protein)
VGTTDLPGHRLASRPHHRPHARGHRPHRPALRSALRPGGFASAEIVSGTLSAPILPESAILSDEKGSYVYVVDAADKVVRRPVKIGQVTAKGIIVREGLAGDERVVLRAGASSTPATSSAPSSATEQALHARKPRRP